MVGRTREQLLAHFNEQIEYLENSNELFDAGKTNEAKRLAVALRVLFHQTSQSHALINQLGLSSLTWVDTAGVVDPTNLLPTTGAVGFEVSISAGIYVPLLDRGVGLAPILTKHGTQIPIGTRIPFEEWWTNPIVKDAAARLFSRKSMVLALANREGGAHVDRETEEAYNAVTESNSLGWTSISEDGVPRPIQSNPIFANVRQISYEVLESVKQQAPLIQ